MLFVDLCAVAVVGFVLGFVIPRGRVPGQDKFFLGLHRHEWATIHVCLSLVFVVLLVIHLWLNWRWVAQVSQRLFEGRWKAMLALLSLSWVPVLFVAWLLAWCF